MCACACVCACACACVRVCVCLTRPEKTSLIHTLNSYYGIYLFFCASYLKSISLLNSLGISAYYDKICVKILASYVRKKSYSIFKDRKLYIDKTCFLRPGKCTYNVTGIVQLQLWILKVLVELLLSYNMGFT